MDIEHAVVERNEISSAIRLFIHRL